MINEELDPVIHVPARLRIVVTLAALPPGDDLSFTRLQDVIGLTPGNLITHLRKLDDAGYVTTEKNGSGVSARSGRADQHRPGRAGPLHHRAPATARLRYSRLSPGSLGCGLSGVISSFIHG
jgi:DNA-binding transcriptional ArsR family regulator